MYRPDIDSEAPAHKPNFTMFVLNLRGLVRGFLGTVNREAASVALESDQSGSDECAMA